MPIKVNIPTPLREFSGGKTLVEVSGATVKAVLEAVCAQHPPLAAKLWQGTEVKPFLNVYLNDEDIRYLDALDTATKDGDEISIIPAVAGG